MKAVARPIFSALRSRSYAAQASVQSVNPSTSRHDLQVTKQANGTLVASMKDGSMLPRVSVYMSAGPRYESHDQLGYCHLLRTASNMTTMGTSLFGISKQTQQLGATLTCSTTRENMVYNVECLPEHLGRVMEVLSDIVCRPRFFPWEIDDMAPRFQMDKALFADNLQARMVEALHKAAYRDGLGNSLYMPDFKLGSFDLDEVVNFYLANYVAGNMSIVGVGVDHKELLLYSKKFDLTGRVAVPQPKGSGYHGGHEIRQEVGTPIVQAIVATEGAAMDSPDVAPLSVLQQVMGAGPFVKYGSNTSSKVSKAVAQATTNPAAASCIMSAYSDSGLFGFQVSTLPQDADKVLRTVAATFAEATKGSLSDEDVERGKTHLKAAYLMTLENGGDALEDMGLQAAGTGEVVTVDQVLAQIEAVTTADVNKVAKKVINGKPCMAAIGDLANTPYLQDIFS